MGKPSQKRLKNCSQSWKPEEEKKQGGGGGIKASGLSHPESKGPGESGAVRDQRDKAAQAGLQLRPLLASSPARSHGRQLWGSMHQGFQACQNQLLGGLKH